MEELYQDILYRLTKGESVDDIAADLSKTINDANKEYTTRMAEAKRKDEEEKQSKYAIAEELINLGLHICEVYHLDDAMYDDLVNMSVDDVVEELDHIVPMCAKLDHDLRALGLAEPRQEAKKCSCAKEDPIERFLDRFVR